MSGSIAADAKSAPKVLLVTELYWPDRRSTGLLMTQLVERLVAQHGASVQVLCGPAELPDSETGESAGTVERVSGLTVRRGEGGESVVLKATRHVALYVQLGWRAFRLLGNVDHVVCVTNPPLLPFIVALGLAGRRSKVNSTCIVHDLYPELLVATGAMRPKSLAVRVLRAMSDWSLGRFSQVIAIGRCMRSRIPERGGKCPAENVVWLPNWNTGEQVGQVAGVPTEECGRIEIVFAGNISSTSGIELLMRSLGELHDLDFRITIVGAGPALSDVKRAVAGRPIESRVRFAEWMDRDRLDDFIPDSSIALVSLAAGMGGVAVPSKIYNELGSGRPLLAWVDPGSEVQALVDEHALGWWAPAGNVGALLDKIRSIAADPLDLVQKRANVAAYNRLAGSRPQTIDRWCRQILDGGSTP